MGKAQTAPDTPALAPAPLGDWWDDTQWAVLLSLLDATLAPIAAADDSRIDAEKKKDQGHNSYADGLDFDRTSFKKMPRVDFEAAVAKARAAMKGPPDAAAVADMLAARLSDNPLHVMSIKRLLSGLSTKSKKDLGGFLKLLSRRTGAYLLTGYCTPVHQQPVHVREAILQGWSRSWTTAIRVAARSLNTIAQMSWTVSSPQFHHVSGYTDHPTKWRAGPSHEFDFLQFGGKTAKPEDTDTTDDLETLDTDVVIVGSGCGGAVCAQVLAAAGHRVVVVEKGYHYPQSQLPMPQDVGTRLLYENNGVAASTDPSLSVIAGACWGGGGTVNWSVSLKTPDRVRQEWAAEDQPGMSFITSSAFDESLERVCDFMGVNHQTESMPDTVEEIDDEQSHRGRVVLDGSIKLGFKAEPLLHNTHGGKLHGDGYCHLGCASAEKRGTSVSWLPEAAKAGAQFIEGFRVERVLFDGDDGTAKGEAAASIPHAADFSDDSPTAIGVVGTWLSRDANNGVAGIAAERTERRVVIKAKKVIVSCGSLWSPVVLMNSGLSNPQIGKNLHLHPCNLVMAYFDEETKPMDKGIITSICTSFVDLDGEFHGPRLESTCMVPYTVLANMPWNSSLDFKLSAMRYRHMDAFISLTRDRDSGRILPDPVTGQPVVDYTPSVLDRDHTAEGAIGIARLCHAQGANEIRAFIAGVRPWTRPAKTLPDDDDDDAVKDDGFEKWTEEIRATAASASPLWGGWNVATPFSSAHQMGTCRMGDDKGQASVVDPRGRVWGTRGLYVADASVFPSASGVNPMVTVMALADHIARGIAQEL
ncbi:long chain fatty acid oxidase [Ophiostoma piceae UAMH 11346]|uniref:long-chain-alcohol oxidase n=1 Tax=Ophiostoma piceae (strain UAMH 11346) TaxID=1262450 RepID=S3BST2_OPHP1|nr:long chain fatty acid oxidase [Ophiostoma piceae UAMH 11346]